MGNSNYVLGKKKYITEWLAKPWKVLPRDPVESPSSEKPKTSLGVALTNMICVALALRKSCIR